MAAAILDEIYEERDIYKALIITADDAETMELVHDLEKKSHTVTYITGDMLDDDRVPVMDRLRVFEEAARIIVMSYHMWYNYREEVEAHVLPNQNLIAFGDLEDGAIEFAMQEMMNSADRGFITNAASNHIIRLYT